RGLEELGAGSVGPVPARGGAADGAPRPGDAARRAVRGRLPVPAPRAASGAAAAPGRRGLAALLAARRPAALLPRPRRDDRLASALDRGVSRGAARRFRLARLPRIAPALARVVVGRRRSVPAPDRRRPHADRVAEPFPGRRRDVLRGAGDPRGLALALRELDRGAARLAPL